MFRCAEDSALRHVDADADPSLTVVGASQDHDPLAVTGADSAATVTDGKLVRTLKATAKVSAILCIVNSTTKWDRGLRTGAEIRLQACSIGVRRNLETVANCTRGVRTRIPDGFQAGLVPKGMEHTIFCWPSAL
jgi:hypothetical protein